ncbi:MAG: efflux RND transporter periplasmic adaptor subunit [Bacteroidales bacterium]|nr:efflux RND transporter periplasmic adaptor subunit [Bacteroidales bacterium]
MNKIYIIIAVCALLCSCGGSEEQSQPLVRSVVVTKPNTIGNEIEKTFSGIVGESREIAVGFKTPGQLKTINVREGSYVRKGQLLATLDDNDYTLGVKALEIQHKQLENEIARMKKLYEAHSISGNDYEKAVAGLKQLEVQLQTNRNKLEYTRLYSPSDGYIQKSNFEPSEMVDAGTPVFTLIDTKNMEVTINVPSDIYQKKDNISQIICRSELAPNKDYEMKILTVAPKADGNQLYQLRLSFVKPDNNVLTAGLNVETVIKIAENKSEMRYSLPLGCIFKDGDNSCVWVLDGENTVHKQQVNVSGIDGDSQALLSGGISGNETIVRAGVNYLQDGEKVKIIDNSSKTNAGNLM